MEPSPGHPRCQHSIPSQGDKYKGGEGAGPASRCMRPAPPPASLSLASRELKALDSRAQSCLWKCLGGCVSVQGSPDRAPRPGRLGMPGVSRGSVWAALVPSGSSRGRLSRASAGLTGHSVVSLARGRVTAALWPCSCCVSPHRPIALPWQVGARISQFLGDTSHGGGGPPSDLVLTWSPL